MQSAVLVVAGNWDQRVLFMVQILVLSWNSPIKMEIFCSCRYVTSFWFSRVNFLNITILLVDLTSLDPSSSSSNSSSAPMTGFSANIQGARVYLQGPAPVGTPSFNRQHFSPHPWTSASNSCRSFVGFLQFSTSVLVFLLAIWIKHSSFEHHLKLRFERQLLNWLKWHLKDMSFPLNFLLT